MANFQSRWPEYDDRAPGDQDRELYERARKAADEAVREGHAQLKAAVAAAGAPRQCVVGTPTPMNRWSLEFTCPRFEAAYRRKAITNSDSYDCIPVIFQIAMCLPQIYMTLNRNRSKRSSFREKAAFLSELWTLWAAISCLAVLAVQLIFPQWYRRNRGATLKYLVMLLWAWGSLKLYLSTDEMMYVTLEVGLMNVYMSFLHLPFLLHLQCRSIGCGVQLVAIFSKGLHAKRTAWIMFFSVVTNAIGVVLSYFIDHAARTQHLRSTSQVLALDEINGPPRRPQFGLSYRTSLSRQFWRTFYPELPGNPDLRVSKAIMYEKIMAPRRALGGFAGGFGGVSSLKCTGPLSNSLSPISSSSGLSGRTSDSSSCDWAGVGTTESGLSCGEIVPIGPDSGGYLRRESALWGPSVTTSACSQAGLEDGSFRSRGNRGAPGKYDQFY